jgi:pimeloyl-ACP methyl ester carboxylesterase
MMEYADVFFHLPDGLQLYARDYPGPAQPAATLVCLHGLTRNSKDFAVLASKLSQRYRVICPDLRGRGRSGRDSNPDHYNPQQYVQDVQALLSHLDISNPILIGTSLGGILSLLLAGKPESNIAAIILNDIGTEVDPTGLARIADYVGKTAPVAGWPEATAITQRVNGSAFPDYTLADWQAMARNLFVQIDGESVLDYDPAISVRFVEDTRTLELWPMLERAAQRPLLVIRGEHSDVLSAQAFAAMQARYPGITAAVIPRRGHAPSLSEADSVTHIFKFLDQLASQKAA